MTGRSHELFYPMFAMFLWTFAVMLRNVQVRVASVLKGELANEYFELFRAGIPSGVVMKTGNHLGNLMEVPPLFYIVCPAILSTQRQRHRVFNLCLELRRSSYRALPGLSNIQAGSPFLFFALSTLALLAMWVRPAVIL